jgi:hypothetical protein
MSEGVNKLEIFDSVILLIAVDMVDKDSDGHRAMMLSPDSTVSHVTVDSDVAFRSNSTTTVLTSLHDAPPLFKTLCLTVQVWSSPAFRSVLLALDWYRNLVTEQSCGKQAKNRAAEPELAGNGLSTPVSPKPVKSSVFPLLFLSPPPLFVSGNNSNTSCEPS